MLAELSNYFRDVDTVDLVEVLATVDHVFSDRRGVLYVDGSLVITAREAKEMRNAARY